MLPVGYFPCTQDPPKGENVAQMIDEIVEQAEVCEQTGYSTASSSPSITSRKTAICRPRC